MNKMKIVVFLIGMYLGFTVSLAGEIKNVMNFSAKGDGRTDDTLAIQQAIDAAIANGGKVYLPSGKYLITKTITISKSMALTIEGEGFGGMRSDPLHTGNFSGTGIVWDGPAGGTMFKSTGNTGLVFQKMSVVGKNSLKKDSGTADIIFHMASVKGYGNMLNKFSNLTIGSAKYGFKYGDKVNMCSSDVVFDYIVVRDLDVAFHVVHSQGVDYLFNFIFGLNCKTVFKLDQGGNMQVNTGQFTSCDLVVDIGGGGRCTGTYLFNNIRLEDGSGGEKNRRQLLRLHPKWQQAIVKFINYDDCQWAWNRMKKASRNTPLCEIGPGSLVIFESSIFNSPLANLKGNEQADARLVVRNSSFSYSMPAASVTANEQGYFKLTDNFDDKMRLLSDRVKWGKAKNETSK